MSNVMVSTMNSMCCVHVVIIHNGYHKVEGNSDCFGIPSVFSGCFCWPIL